ncbi:hypothetical protein LOY85_02810 [Brevibacillus brevis]|uniref:hypothetical protein n=1 Tax=Brevibacillus brevis TaxID=1393 RepID=UPI001F1BF786|nr:hypothetical protein [Brevibacillus brevis]UIO43099.1 hypothetical protein LOY85_02810 [Brevibacillus brevis]
MFNLVLLHVLVSVGYSWMQSRGKNKQVLIMRMLVTGFLPIFGLLLLGITDVYKRTSKKNVNELMLESDLLKLAEGSNIFRRADMEKEMNIVPVEDILFLNDTSTRRKMLIDVLKEQTIWQIGTLETALQNEDSETVHYAAAALTEMRRNLQLQLQDLSVKYEENKQELAVLRAYADVLKKYLDSSLLDQRTYVKYSYTYSFVLESLLDIYQEEESYFVDKINCELGNQSYEKAEQYCQLFREYHPESEQPYVMSLKRFFTIRDYAGFVAEMNRLKSSSVKISHATLMMIRYWNDEQDSNWAEVAVTQEIGTKLKEMSDTK